LAVGTVMGVDVACGVAVDAVAVDAGVAVSCEVAEGRAVAVTLLVAVACCSLDGEVTPASWCALLAAIATIGAVAGWPGAVTASASAR
jgi:hypothetical protein